MSTTETRTDKLVAIHGDKQQNERDWVLNEFKTGKSPIMVATDVASRGIGMVAIAPALPFPPCLMLCCVICVMLCSLFSRAPSLAFMTSRALSFSRFSSWEPWFTEAKLASLVSVSLRTSRVQSRIGFLTCSSHTSKVS